MKVVSEVVAVLSTLGAFATKGVAQKPESESIWKMLFLIEPLESTKGSSIGYSILRRALEQGDSALGCDCVVLCEEVHSLDFEKS
jgi:hypothetical protein